MIKNLIGIMITGKWYLYWCKGIDYKCSFKKIFQKEILYCIFKNTFFWGNLNTVQRNEYIVQFEARYKHATKKT